MTAENKPAAAGRTVREGKAINVLFIGDVVGAAGRKALKSLMSHLKSKYSPHFIIVNGENAAGGKGITPAIVSEFLELGVDVITMGNHTWDNKDIFSIIDTEERLLRPANFPEGTPGRGACVIRKGGKELAVVNIQGRTFLPALDCPFRTADALIQQWKPRVKCIFVDFHAEATSEKIAMSWYLDGRASLVIGTHTHVQTNDDRILPGGTACLTDVGMVGSRDGVLGMERSSVEYRFLTQLPSRFTVDEGRWQFHAVVAEIDEATGKAKSIAKIRLTEDEWLMMR